MSALRLPLLEPHRASLETCVYCPKLSRAACPVSEVEKSETVTPWGKMSLAYFAARGDVPLDATHAEPAWACTACYACRERCDHKNEVATVLTDARAELFEVGAAPAGARRVAARWRDVESEAVEAARAFTSSEPKSSVVDGGATRPVDVLVGCGYARWAPETARDALAATSALVGRPARPLGGCCGLPLLHAGDRRGFIAAATAFAHELAGRERVVVVDPGCFRALTIEYPRAAVPAPRAELFVDLAAAAIERFTPRPTTERVRYHDPCQLGRGLGRFDQPRAVVAAAVGKPAESFLREREHGECSGAGGLLPVTRPESSRAIADARLAEHAARGGGVLVTHCASSLHRFRTRGAQAIDLASLVARALVP